MGQVKIVSKSGHWAHFEFIPKAWFSGQYHTFKAELFNSQKDSFATISGKWTEESKIKYTSASPNGTSERTFFDAIKENRETLTPKPLEEQGPLETNQVWGKVTQALKDGNFSAANKFKSEVEEEQRRLRKERKETEEDWQPAFFKYVKDAEDEELLELCKVMTRVWNINARQEEEVDGVKVKAEGLTIEEGFYVFKNAQ
eukprot:NODE_135_length_16508_cov_1.365897.p11 type:complete len:200 gc:universal NODE_135_length_16508_cov_1.365897:7352-6753(-)